MIRRGEGGVERRGGPSWSPVGGEAIVVIHDGSQGNRTRATMKALPSTLHPPSPLRSTQRHFVRLMRIRADKSAVCAINRHLRWVEDPHCGCPGYFVNVHNRRCARSIGTYGFPRMWMRTRI